jgi:hypothetical protein
MGRYTYRGGVAVGRSTRYVATRTISAHGVAVRGSFAHYHCFRGGWFTAHPYAWRAAAWTAASFWAGATWGSVSSYCGYPAEPVMYDYGTTLVYEDNRVYNNGVDVGTSEQYAEQAITIATEGQNAKVTEKEKWTSLGVFGMVQGEEKDANLVFQLAINKDGVIRGNFYNALTDHSTPVNGSVDKKTQRAAWMIGDKKNTVYEAGIANLTKKETTMLVHYGKDRTQQWTLVRLDPPKEEKKD